MALSWQDRYEQKLAAQRNAAHERFMESRRNFAEANPNAMSPQERRQIMFGNAEDKGGLMMHEKEMLREKNAGELAVAQEKRAGMREQGSDAAAANAEAAQRTAEIEWAGRKGIAEMEADSKRYIADKDAETKTHIADKDFEGKRYGYDTQFDIAEQQGKDNLEIEKQKGKDAQALAETQGGTAERVAATQAQAQAEKQNTPKVMSEADESKAARDLVKQSNGRLSYEQALAQVRAGKGGSGSGGLSKYRK